MGSIRTPKKAIDITTVIRENLMPFLHPRYLMRKGRSINGCSLASTAPAKAKADQLIFCFMSNKKESKRKGIIKASKCRFPQKFKNDQRI